MQYSETLNELIKAINTIEEKMKKLAERLFEDFDIGGILEEMRLYDDPPMPRKKQRAPRSLYLQHLFIVDKRAAIRRLQTVRNV